MYNTVTICADIICVWVYASAFVCVYSLGKTHGRKKNMAQLATCFIRPCIVVTVAVDTSQQTQTEIDILYPSEL